MNLLCFSRHSIFLLLSLYVHLGLLIILIPPVSLLRLLSVFSLLVHGLLGYCLADLDLPFSREHYTDCQFIGLHVFLFANYHLYLALKSPPSSCKTLAQKAKWVTKHILSSPREDIRNKPPFSSHNVSHVPPRRSFVISHTLRIIFFILAQKAFRQIQGRLYYANLSDGDYDEEKESIVRRAFLGDVKSRELWIRAWLPLDFFVGDYLSKNILYSSLALLAVVIFQDSHARWPPLYGRIGEAYTLRRVWGAWRHQLPRVAYVAHAKTLTSSLLGSRCRVLQRGLITFFVFAIAAFLNAIPAKDGGFSFQVQVTLWLSLAAGILFEDLFIAVLRIIVPRNVRNWRLVYFLGYFWVYLFYWWYLPKHYFPSAEYYVYM